MRLCPDCERLTRHPKRIGIPSNLNRIATLRRNGDVTFRFECRHCETHWECLPGEGWRLDPGARPPMPLLGRVAAAARSTLSRLRA